jgi:hypothetical protein
VQARDSYRNPRTQTDAIFSYTFESVPLNGAKQRTGAPGVKQCMFPTGEGRPSKSDGDAVCPTPIAIADR